MEGSSQKSSENQSKTTAKESEKRLHGNYSLKNVSPSDADGIETCYLGEYICNTCGTLLAKCESSISGTFNDIIDSEWAARNNIKFME